MRAALLLALAAAPQDAELDAALAREKARIAAKTPLSAEARRAYAAPEPPAPARVVERHRLAVAPLDFSDAAESRPLDDDLKALAAFYAEMSGKRFTLEASLVGRVALDRSRDATGRIASGSEDEKNLARDAIGALRNRLGEEAFAKIDSVAFVAAGAIGARDTALWPHQGSVALAERAIGYLILPEQAGARWLGIAAHEFGHLLGLEDKYEDKEANVGKWCLMGTGYLGEPGDRQKKPLPLCAVCRARLGWLAEATLDPRTERAVVLAPGQAVRVRLNPDDKEAVVLEARSERELVVWHTGGGKAIELAAVLPTAESDRLTPHSRPPLKGRTTGGWPVAVTDVRPEEGRLWLRVSVDAPLTPLEELLRSRRGKTLGQ